VPTLHGLYVPQLHQFAVGAGVGHAYNNISQFQSKNSNNILFF